MGPGCCCHQDPEVERRARVGRAEEGCSSGRPEGGAALRATRAEEYLLYLPVHRIAGVLFNTQKFRRSIVRLVGESCGVWARRSRKRERFQTLDQVRLHPYEFDNCWSVFCPYTPPRCVVSLRIPACGQTGHQSEQSDISERFFWLASNPEPLEVAGLFLSYQNDARACKFRGMLQSELVLVSARVRYKVLRMLICQTQASK